MSRLGWPHGRLGQISWLVGLILVVISVVPGQAAWEHNTYAVIYDVVGWADWVDTCSDEHGGMLVAMFDNGPAASRVAVSRLSNTGTEMWGDGGRGIPFNLSTISQEGPMALASDGQGGAYVAYREVWPGDQHIVTVGHITAEGLFDWSLPVGDFVAGSVNLTIDLVPSAGDVIVVWSEFSASPRLMAAAVDYQGTELWEIPVADNMTVEPEATVWHASSDGMAGALIAFDRQPFMANREHRVVRVDDAGSLPWGLNGTLMWQNFNAVAGVLHDGAGGAIVLNHAGYGEVWAQRVDALGAVAWAAAGVKVLDLNLSLMLDQIGFCSNNGGGAIVATGLDDLYAQQVSFAGNLMWAGGSPTGVQITSRAGWQNAPALCPDASGGAFIVYRDHYYSDGSDPNNQMLSGARINAGGTLAWSESILLWDGFHDNFEPFALQLVSDGIGGALLAWNAHPYGGSQGQDVRALSLGADAEVPAKPSLKYITPDAGLPGSSHSAIIRGNYVDTNLEFALSRNGHGSLPVTPLGLVGPGMLEVTFDLTGAAPGPWDLVVLVDGLEEHALPALFGVGEPPPDTGIQSVAIPSADFDLSGNPHKVDFDGAGRAHAVYIEQTSTYSHVYLHTYSNDVDELVRVWEAPPNLWDSSAVLDVGPDDRVHVMFWESREPAGVVYQRFNPEGILEYQTFLAIGHYGHSLAVSDDGVAHIVTDKHVGTQLNLYHWMIYGDTVTGPNLIQEDLNWLGGFDLISCGPNGLSLAFTKDGSSPDESELFLQIYAEESWQEAAPVWMGPRLDSICMAWDGYDAVLLAFTQSPVNGYPTPVTCKIVGGVPGPVVERFEEGMTIYPAVAASGRDDFWLATNGGVSHIQEYARLRRGDGFTFYPGRMLNQGWGASDAQLGAGPEGVYAYFNDFTTIPGQFYYCALDPTSATPEVLSTRGNLQISPNPFNARTNVRFALDQGVRVRLQVYDLHGRRIRTLLDGQVPAGDHVVPWDGRNERGAEVASGVYLYRLEAGDRVEVGRAALVK